jgi:predicted AlkP superfamily pyrophosphatase or phosphodiesterase
MIRRNFMGAIGLVTVALTAGATEPRKPNIVFVLVDQLRADVLGCYGGENIATPNMDRIANEGLKLPNSSPIGFCPTPAQS